MSDSHEYVRAPEHLLFGRDDADALAARPYDRPWPDGTVRASRHHTLVCLEGDYAGGRGDDALAALRQAYPWRHVTRCGNTIVVWPVGTVWVSHQPGAVILRGDIDGLDRAAVQAMYPGRTVSCDGAQLTVWPPADHRTATRNRTRTD
ncbi:hypothetical protein [Streptomyces sp. NPDC048445]|uniref:hypothetical protein n=1 Tax=Streptomyces sp. NPDC048445 TaxID=3365553 RepID=UPI00371E1D31